MGTYGEIKNGMPFDVYKSQCLNFACCDCGLVHNVQFKNKRMSTEITMFRDNRRTGQKRRWKKIKEQNNE